MPRDAHVVRNPLLSVVVQYLGQLMEFWTHPSTGASRGYGRRKVQSRPPVCEGTVLRLPGSYHAGTVRKALLPVFIVIDEYGVKPSKHDKPTANVFHFDMKFCRVELLKIGCTAGIYYRSGFPHKDHP